MAFCVLLGRGWGLDRWVKEMGKRRCGVKGSLGVWDCIGKGGAWVGWTRYQDKICMGLVIRVGFKG